MFTSQYVIAIALGRLREYREKNWNYGPETFSLAKMHIKLEISIKMW